MKGKKITAAFILAAFIFSLTACAGAPVQDVKADKAGTPKTAKQQKLEQEEDSRAVLVKGTTGKG